MIALAAALAISAPLVHAHLESAASQGWCGEHDSDNAPAPASEACTLCLAGAHAPATREPGALRWELRAAPIAAPAAPPAIDRSIARSRPGTPRAPPLPA